MPHKISLKECAIVELPTFTDSRGSLSLVDSDTAAKLLPFKPERVFWIHGTEEHTIRGQHAHRSCWELVVAVSGSFSLTLNDGKNDKTFLLDSPQRGVIIPPMVWCRLHNFAPDTVCLTLASGDYDAQGYINDFNIFKSIAQHD